MASKKEEKEDLRYSQACIDHRKNLHMPELDENTRNVDCNNGRFCYDEGCPIFVKPKEEEHYSYPLYCPEAETLAVCKRDKCAIDKNCRYKTKHSKEEPKDLGQGFKSDGTRHLPSKVTKDNIHGLNLEVFEEIGDEKPKKKKKEMSVREFLNIQMRVLEKLSWHPEIYEALDNLPSTEILDRLLGKTGLEGVATHVGGDMKLKASTKTKQLFENLEKQFADEDEKKGKGAPPNYENIGTPEEINRALGLVPPNTPNYETVGHLPADRDFTFTWVDDKEEKKNGKKNKK